MNTTRVHFAPPRTLPLYARAAAAMIPAARMLPWVPGESGEISDLCLALGGIRADPRHVARYRSVCGLDTNTETLPVGYPHVLAFGLQMATLTDGSFPHPPVGLVHIENRIVNHRAIPRDEQLELHVHAGGAAPHPRGESFQLITRALVAHELMWEETSTMLHRTKSSRDRSDGAKDEQQSDLAGSGEEEQDGDVWRLPRDLGRRYAAISGDRNPIHTHPIAARAFGFRGAIAHGMWTFARVLATVVGEFPDGHAVEASFRKPIVLAASVQVSSRAAGPETEFSVRDAARHHTHLRGRVWPTSAEQRRPSTRKQEA
jgi:acyl dehydratase